MSRAALSVALTARSDDDLQRHLLQHFLKGKAQEDLCFALWFPSFGRNRRTALIHRIIRPEAGDRELHGNVAFSAQYFDRVLRLAIENEAGIAFLHSHPVPGWQNMSRDDIVAEQRLSPRVLAATGLPLVGLTVGTDGAWSARFWQRTDRGEYQHSWCATVRVVGERFGVTFMKELAPAPVYREELQRTYSAWGATKQQVLARLRIGIVGAGSVGSIVAEALARMGIEDILLMDFDVVKKHNLDRLLHATVRDIGRQKVEVVAEHVSQHATAANFRVEALPLSVTSEEGFRSALDTDVVFSCVDRPWPRNVLNHMAYAHLIPVIDGGISVRVTSRGAMRGAEWRAHVAVPGRPCLQCLGQFDPADVSLERSGLLDDPSYIAGLPRDHFIHHNENVFAFAMNAAGMQIAQFLTMVIAPGGIADVGAQTYHFATGMVDRDQRIGCLDSCLYPSIIGLGDRSGLVVTG